MNKKQFLALVMAVSMTFGAVPAMAADSSGTKEIETETGSASFDVNTDISKDAASDTGDTSYYVKISWETTNGSYQLTGDHYKWDAKNKKYVKQNKEQTFDSEKAATAKITIENQSNEDVAYDIAYTAATDTTTGISSTESSDDAKTGTLLSFITKNNIDVTADTSGADEITDASWVADTATYNGTIALTNYKTGAMSKKTEKLGTYNVTIGEKELTYTATSSSTRNKTISTADLGDSTTMTFTDGTNYTVYTGIATSTAGWNWNDAQGFVKTLNDNNYQGHSTWALLPYTTNETDLTTMKAVIKDSLDDIPDGVEFLWTSSTGAANCKVFSYVLLTDPNSWEAGTNWDYFNQPYSDARFGFMMVYTD